MPLKSSHASFAVNTYSYTTLEVPVKKCLEGLARRGYDEFELMVYPGHLWPAHLDQPARQSLKEFVACNNLRITTLNMPNIDINIVAANPEMRDMSLGFLRRVIELAGDIGVEGVVIGPGKANPLLPMPKSQLLEHFHQAMKQLVPFAASRGTAIYVENMPFAFLPRIEELLEAVALYGDDNVGILYDVANGHFMKEDVHAALRACASRLRALHLSDTGHAVYRHDEIGHGTVDFASLPPVLAEVGFIRKPILEIISSDADGAIDRSVQRLFEMGLRQ